MFQELRAPGRVWFPLARGSHESRLAAPQEGHPDCRHGNKFKGAWVAYTAIIHDPCLRAVSLEVGPARGVLCMGLVQEQGRAEEGGGRAVTPG